MSSKRCVFWLLLVLCRKILSRAFLLWLLNGTVYLFGMIVDLTFLRSLTFSVTYSTLLFYRICRH